MFKIPDDLLSELIVLHSRSYLMKGIAESKQSWNFKKSEFIKFHNLESLSEISLKLCV